MLYHSFGQSWNHASSGSSSQQNHSSSQKILQYPTLLNIYLTGFYVRSAERLKTFCKGIATLDIIMLEEEWSFIRHYTYNPARRKGKEAFFATDGSDQSMIVMFAPEGCAAWILSFTTGRKSPTDRRPD